MGVSVKLPCHHELCNLCAVRCDRCPFCRTDYNPVLVCGEGAAVIFVNIQQHIKYSYFLRDEEVGQDWVKEFSFYCTRLGSEEETYFSWLVSTPFNFALATGPDGAERILGFYNFRQIPSFNQVKD